MPLDPRKHFPVMCLTMDGLGTTHARQAGELCAAGAGWIQLRMKHATDREWLSEAREAVEACRRHGAILVVNDSVAVARESGADGVHLGSLDADWREARRVLGPSFLIGGTVNNAADARRAVESGCLDYVGVGPLRFTATKRGLSPVIGIGGVRSLIALLRGLPAWVIGGVVPADLPEIRSTGAAGAAVSSYLFQEGGVGANLGELLRAWAQSPDPVLIP
jgi:thiamine-phosphate pyrophosphorylase